MSRDQQMSDREREFALAMREIYRRAKEELGYNATYFAQLLSTDGPLPTARRLIMSNKPADGFTTLWEHGRLDLTVEAHVIQPRFESLFTEEEVEAARQRLARYGYSGEF